MATHGGRPSLKKVNPELCKEWDYKRNEFGPEDVTPSSNKKAHWICQAKGCGHRWLAVIASRTKGNGCPGCSGHAVTSKNNLKAKHPGLAKEWDHKRNDFGPEDVSAGSGKKAHWICQAKGCSHRWLAVIASRTQGIGCPGCAGRAVTSKHNLKAKHPELCKEWDYEQNDFGPESVTPGSHKKAHWICQAKGCGHRWLATIGHRTRGNGCPGCSGNAVSSKNNLKAKHPDLAKEWDYKRNDFGPEDVSAGSGKKAHWICQAKGCGHRWFAVIADRTRGRGCPGCADSGFSPDKAGYLYLSFIDDLGLIKFGITNREPETRLMQQARSSGCTHELLYSYYFDSGEDALNVERAIKRAFKCGEHTVGHDWDGHTETLPMKLLDRLLAFVDDELVVAS